MVALAVGYQSKILYDVIENVSVWRDIRLLDDVKYMYVRTDVHSALRYAQVARSLCTYAIKQNGRRLSMPRLPQVMLGVLGNGLVECKTSSHNGVFLTDSDFFQYVHTCDLDAPYNVDDAGHITGLYVHRHHHNLLVAVYSGLIRPSYVQDKCIMRVWAPQFHVAKELEYANHTMLHDGHIAATVRDLEVLVFMHPSYREASWLGLGHIFKCPKCSYIFDAVIMTEDLQNVYIFNNAHVIIIGLHTMHNHVYNVEAIKNMSGPVDMVLTYAHPFADQYMFHADEIIKIPVKCGFPLCKAKAVQELPEGTVICYKHRKPVPNVSGTVRKGNMQDTPCVVPNVCGSVRTLCLTLRAHLDMLSCDYVDFLSQLQPLHSHGDFYYATTVLTAIRRWAQDALTKFPNNVPNTLDVTKRVTHPRWDRHCDFGNYHTMRKLLQSVKVTMEMKDVIGQKHPHPEQRYLTPGAQLQENVLIENRMRHGLWTSGVHGDETDPDYITPDRPILNATCPTLRLPTITETTLYRLRNIFAAVPRRLEMGESQMTPSDFAFTQSMNVQMHNPSVYITESPETQSDSSEDSSVVSTDSD